MTALSQLILDSYQVRKTKAQKTSFIQLMQDHFPDLKIQTGGFPKCRNLIIGDVNEAKLVLSAHYDTCAQMPVPNFIAPKNPVISIAYSILLVIPIFLLSYLLGILLSVLSVSPLTSYLIALGCYIFLLVMLLFGPANKHNANDNTSGVILLCELLQCLTPQMRKKVAFVFFDGEEIGLVGSSVFRASYKTAMKHKLLINFDCIADGDHILLAMTKAARSEYMQTLSACFQPKQDKSVLLTKSETTYYPSDQMGFKTAIAVAAAKRKPLIGYYISKIHTRADTCFDKTNIKLLSEGMLALIQKI